MTSLVLPTAGANGTTITWSAAPEYVINTTTGEVTRPTDADKIVTLTATISRAGGSRSNEITISVIFLIRRSF
jgi:hypothetical protein